MAQLKCNSPLNWPEGLTPTPRGNQRADSGFPLQMPIMEAINYLQEEIIDDRFSNAILSCDIEQPLIDRLRKKVGSRSGAALQFKCFGRAYVVACDRWLSVEHNIYALYLTVRHWRNMERWGIGSLAALMNGFEASNIRQNTPGNVVSAPAWMDAFGLGPTATLEDATAIYHRRAKMVADNTELLTKLNLLMDEARSYFSGKSS